MMKAKYNLMITENTGHIYQEDFTSMAKLQQRIRDFREEDKQDGIVKYSIIDNKFGKHYDDIIL